MEDTTELIDFDRSCKNKYSISNKGNDPKILESKQDSRISTIHFIISFSVPNSCTISSFFSSFTKNGLKHTFIPDEGIIVSYFGQCFVRIDDIDIINIFLCY